MGRTTLGYARDVSLSALAAKPTFVTLPLEIRLNIYKHLARGYLRVCHPQYQSLSAHEKLVLLAYRKGGKEPPFIPGLDAKLHRSILPACRQTHNEAAPVLYRRVLLIHTSRQDWAPSITLPWVQNITELAFIFGNVDVCLQWACKLPKLQRCTLLRETWTARSGNSNFRVLLAYLTAVRDQVARLKFAHGLPIRLQCQLKWRLEPDAHNEYLVHTGQISYTEIRRMVGCALPDRTDEY
jgi:hypothetical protein